MKERSYSLEELDSFFNIVVDRLNKTLAAGRTEEETTAWPFKAWVDIPNNRVVVEIDKAFSLAIAKAAVIDYVPQNSINYVSVSREIEVDASCNLRQNCDDAPLRGGIKILTLKDDSSCSSGFVMERNENLELLTAGHCDQSNIWYQSYAAIGTSLAIGTTQWSKDAGNVDAQLISIRPERAASNVVYRQIDHETRIEKKISDPNEDLIGNRLCSLGAVGGEKCGELTSLKASFNGRKGFGEFKVTSDACRGDSGGPVVNASTNRAYGIVSYVGLRSLKDTCGPVVGFTWLSNIEKASGAKILLTRPAVPLSPSPTISPTSVKPPINGAVIVPGPFFSGKISSPNGLSLEMQSDGNFVLRKPGNIPIWSSKTAGNPGAVVNIQSDGNVVVRGPGNVPLWSTKTAGNPGATFEFQYDGNLVVYAQGHIPKWSSDSSRFFP